MAKYVYSFGPTKTEGSAKDKNLLGGKGANLAEMSRIGIPVPAGFTISTEVCTYYYKHGRSYPKTLAKEVERAIKQVEKEMGAKFGDEKNPLLVSVRSGARVSMPGMMETILNVGLNDKTVEGLAKKSGDGRFAYDCYRRFIQMYAATAMHADRDAYENALHALKEKRGVELDTELTVDDLKDLVDQFKKITKKETGKNFPTAPMDQLWGAVNAVFGSWQIDKARTYRRLHNIPEEWGTAVNVCAMVFGNMGENSATGVAFTRDPGSGEKIFFGEYLINAQGEDVVAGIRTPQPINKAAASEGEVSLEEAMPKAYKELVKVYKKLEKHYKDMQDLEFTIQDGKLWMLQTRNGKRTGFAAVKLAVDFVNERLIKSDMAIRRVEPGHLVQLLAPVFHVKDKAQAVKDGKVAAKGIKASPGAACGKVAFTADKAMEMRRKGEDSLLVRIETSPEDIGGMDAAVGILTARGGATSHAAVVARGMGKPCVCGVGALKIDYQKLQFTVKGQTVKEGEYVSIDGTTGEVLLEKLPTEDSEVVRVLQGKLSPKKSELYQDYAQLMTWVDKARQLKVRTNCDTPEDAKFAAALGAEGIGLCRTEHMFFGEKRITPMREMILADDEKGRRKALKKLLPFQRSDFKGIFEAMQGMPVTIRLLDPPLHEFLPNTPEAQEEVAKELGVSANDVKQKVDELHEMNPMLGHRGCRLGITYPEITEMQARAIFEAAAALASKGKKVEPEVMVPLIGTVAEFINQRDVIVRVADEVMTKKKVKFPYLVGTMIEVPRAALIADKVAEHAEFFSFGTNDLTQMTMGYSRDDAGKFIAYYMDDAGGERVRILENDPFETLDQEGVGQLVKLGAERGRSTNPKLKLGICGEHGGDPASVRFCHNIGLDYVSCSPYRVPVARLTAAQEALVNPRGKTSKVKKAASKAKKAVKAASKATSKATKKAAGKKNSGRKPASKASVKSAAAWGSGGTAYESNGRGGKSPAKKSSGKKKAAKKK